MRTRILCWCFIIQIAIDSAAALYYRTLATYKPGYFSHHVSVFGLLSLPITIAGCICVLLIFWKGLGD